MRPLEDLNPHPLWLLHWKCVGGKACLLAGSRGTCVFAGGWDLRGGVLSSSLMAESRLAVDKTTILSEELKI